MFVIICYFQETRTKLMFVWQAASITGVTVCGQMYAGATWLLQEVGVNAAVPLRLFH